MPDFEKVQALRGNYISAIGYPIALLAAKKIDGGCWAGELFLLVISTNEQAKLIKATRSKFNLGKIDETFVLSELFREAKEELQIFIDAQRIENGMIPENSQFSLSEIGRETVIGAFANHKMKDQLEVIRNNTDINSLKIFLPETEQLGSFIYERTPITINIPTARAAGL